MATKIAVCVTFPSHYKPPMMIMLLVCMQFHILINNVWKNYQKMTLILH